MLFITHSPQQNRDLILGPITLHVRRLGMRKLIKLGRIEGLIAHESAAQAGPKSCIKWILEESTFLL